MEIKNKVYVTNREDWREWLEKNHKKQKEIWLIYYRKETNKSRISYDDAVLEALAYGWIDSIVKKIDAESFAQRFSQRKSKSALSQMNRERVRELIKEDKMTKWGLEAIAHAFNPKTDKDEKLKISSSTLKALQANKEAWKYFQKMSPAYRRIRIAYIDGYRKYNADIYKKNFGAFCKNDSAK